MPKLAIQYWRQQWDDDDELYTDTFAKNLLAAQTQKLPSSPLQTR